MAEKSSSASVVDLHAAMGVGRRNQTGYFVDVPPEQLYTRLAHVRDTKEVGVAVFAALGFKAEGPQSWGAFVPGGSTGPRGRRGCSPAAAAENGDLRYGPLMK